MTWPPVLNELKADLNRSVDTDDDVLQTQLDAAVYFVEHVRPEFDYVGDVTLNLPEPPPDLRLGTLRLAGRWYTRRRSPDMLISAADMGNSRIPAFDPDIERLLKIGRNRKSIVA